MNEARPPVWVLDTNVIVSGLLVPISFPGLLIDYAAAGRLVIAYNEAIRTEYFEVLARSRLGIDPDKAGAFTRSLSIAGYVADAPAGSLDLPDPDDELFLAVALATQDRVLVTGNTRHFPVRLHRGVTVLTPREAVGRLRR